MPELPEVETVRRGLAPVMEGARFTHVTARAAGLRFPFPDGFESRLISRTVTALSRRAKYLLADLDSGAVLIMHLGMSGSFRIEDGESQMLPGAFHIARSKSAIHDHVVFGLSTATGTHARVIYNDPRRFGYMNLVDRAKLGQNPPFAGLGIEPTGNRLDGATLASLLDGRTSPLKAALLDQRLVAGLGNIYVCEALWQAGLSPRRRSGSLGAPDGRATARSERLAAAIRDVIARAIEAGGSTLRDHRLTDGSLGYFQHSFQVYDREGQACRKPGCTGMVQRIVQSGRSTFFCPSCQR